MKEWGNFDIFNVMAKCKTSFQPHYTICSVYLGSDFSELMEVNKALGQLCHPK
jgi:hypothetical protein